MTHSSTTSHSSSNSDDSFSSSGEEQQHLIDDLSSCDLTVIKKISDIIKANPKLKVVLMVGAGISTSCGIPDFRSPKTGLYHNLSKLNLPYAEAIFDIDFFKENPQPFYTLAQELYPGKYKPSRFHFFMKLLEDKNRLQRIYTQNIDTLERQAGIDPEYIIEAHGSFAGNHCIKCGKQYEMEYFKSKLSSKEGAVDYARCESCQGLVKPNIVFFGEDLPKRFFETWDRDLELMEKESKGKETDFLVLVAGTSLAVYPFATLPTEVPTKTFRSLINKDICGDFEQNPRLDDLIFAGEADEAADKLAKELGWTKELDEYCSKFKVEGPVEPDKEVDKVLNELEKLEL